MCVQLDHFSGPKTKPQNAGKNSKSTPVKEMQKGNGKAGDEIVNKTDDALLQLF